MRFWSEQTCELRFIKTYRLFRPIYAELISDTRHSRRMILRIRYGMERTLLLPRVRSSKSDLIRELISNGMWTMEKNQMVGKLCLTTQDHPQLTVRRPDCFCYCFHGQIA